MKKIIIAPDSFKETMTNIEVTDIIHESLKESYPEYEYKLFPIADGGEGSLNAFYKTGGELKTCNSLDANGNKNETNYLLYNDIIVLEVAQNIGFKYKLNTSNPGNTTTIGIGETLKEAIKTGIKKVYICLGGTITNDGGCGLASSLGVKFYDEKNNEFVPTGSSLHRINKIDNSNYLNNYRDLEIIGLCDVTNPLYGFNGASYIFAPQKGADEKMVYDLDQGLIHLANIVKKDLNIDKADVAGTGAAGGLGYCIVAFLNGKLQKGIDTILNIINLENEINDDTIIITGEGKLDNQSLNGKVISGILKRKENTKAKLVVVCGKFEGDYDYYYKQGIDQIVITNEENLDFETVKKVCKRQLYNAVKKIKL